MSEVILYDYWRSSASYRVRIALNLKGVAYRSVPVSLIDGEHRAEGYLERNPQGFVPMLSIDGHDLTQSLAIIDYLDAKFREPRMVSSNPAERAKTLAQSLIIAADIHPINNLRVLKYLQGNMGQEQAAVDGWYRHWIIEGFTALESMAPETWLFGGAQPNLADVCLVPQMANARRFETPLEAFPKLVRIDAALREIEAFAKAAPEAVKP
ncbi:MAG: maleylacetoacetate isomerase [Sphingomonadales bacterium]|nr:maleylacetoacetate isomerase [Sphingomonadales bacterium]